MRKLYQTSWHGIPFNSFADVSLTAFPSAHFYEQFYRAFFKRYARLEDLDSRWLRLKQATLEHIYPQLVPSQKTSLLSIGCGIGVIEIGLWNKGYRNLDVIELAEAPLKWLRDCLPAQHIYIGAFPEALPERKCYDSILLSSVDYAFDETHLAAFLSDVQSRLRPGGHCTLLAYSLEPSGRLARGRLKAREGLERLREWIGAAAPRQLWGYVRRREEYQALFQQAGFNQVSDELFPTGTPWMTYRITGHRSLQATALHQVGTLKEVNA